MFSWVAGFQGIFCETTHCSVVVQGEAPSRSCCSLLAQGPHWSGGHHSLLLLRAFSVRIQITTRTEQRSVKSAVVVVVDFCDNNNSSAEMKQPWVYSGHPAGSAAALPPGMPGN